MRKNILLQNRSNVITINIQVIIANIQLSIIVKLDFKRNFYMLSNLNIRFMGSFFLAKSNFVFAFYGKTKIIIGQVEFSGVLFSYLLELISLTYRLCVQLIALRRKNFILMEQWQIIVMESVLESLQTLYSFLITLELQRAIRYYYKLTYVKHLAL